MRSIHDEILSLEHESFLFDNEKIKKNYVEMLKMYSHLKDKHFDKEIIQGIEKFQQRFFEAYLGCYLLNRNFEVMSYPKGRGPDFLVGDISIECVAPTSGDESNNNTVPQMIINHANQNKFEVNDIPEKEIMLRLSSAFLSKYRKYCNDIEKEIVSTEINLIAINDGVVGYTKLEDNLPRIVKVLYGIGNQVVDRNTPSKRKFVTRDSVLNSNESVIELDYFTSEKYGEISGVIFSSACFYNLENEIGYDLILILNPFAKSKVPIEFYQNSFYKVYEYDLVNGVVVSK